MWASLRKSHAACDAWPAPPPEPQKNRRPPSSRVFARTSTIASMSESFIRSRMTRVSSRNERENELTAGYSRGAGDGAAVSDAVTSH